MTNVLLEPVQYKVTETRGGTWRRHLHASGRSYAEFTSRARVLSLPLVHYTSGISPETGTHRVARGFIAVGHRAVGIIAIGRFSAGLVAVGQLSVGLLALGQLCGGVAALGQMSVGLAIGMGQVATGVICVAQVGVGKWVLAQAGVGEHLWTMGTKDPAAIEFFQAIGRALGFAGGADA